MRLERRPRAAFPAAVRSHVLPFRQRASTTAGPTLTETCGTRSWGRSSNASFARVLTVGKTANASPAPPSTRASTLSKQLESAVRRAQVIGGGGHALAPARRRDSSVSALSSEGAAEANHTTQCYPGNPDSLLVYKVESSFRVDPPSRLRVIAVERPGIAEVELQVWKWLEGA